MMDLRVSTIQETTVHLPDGDVRLREMCGIDRLGLEQAWMKYTDEGPDTVFRMAQLVVWCAVDDDGDRMYGEEDVETLAKGHNFDALDELFRACLKLNHMDKESAEEKVKNSDPVRAA